MSQLVYYLANNIMMMIIIILMIMISVAFLTLFERKILSYMHYRKGPNKVGFMGLLQPFSDALKLLTKEFFSPVKTNYLYYLISPLVMFLLAMTLWMLYPFNTNLLNWNLNSLFFLCFMSLGVYSLMMMGWSSNSSFSMLGSIRSIAQSISYEVTLAISFLLPLMMINSLNLYNIFKYQKYSWLFIFLWPSMMILLTSMLAEINRTPFDLSEGESELVSGFNIEYSNYGFVLIFFSEYTSIMMMMFLFSWMNFCPSPFSLMLYLMTIYLTFLIIWIRVTLPRIRYDFLMTMCWFYMLPYILMMFMTMIFFFKYPTFLFLN